MPYSRASLDLPRCLVRFIGLVVIAGGLTACEDDEVRGVFVAKFLDGSARFVKRITISTIDGPILSLALVAKSKRCELIAPVPAGALSGIGDCKDISGIASLRCEGQKALVTRWQMTSCHSGYGRSLEGTEPAFLFGFSGNSYTAQNQLELAMAAKFVEPVNVCPTSIEPNPQNECNEANIPSLFQLLELTSESKLP